MWVWLLANKLVQFVLLTDSFIIVICKTSEISALNVNNNSFLDPLVNVTLEKRIPGPEFFRTFSTADKIIQCDYSYGGYYAVFFCGTVYALQGGSVEEIFNCKHLCESYCVLLSHCDL